MKINYTELISILEKKSNRAISRLDELKCYTPEFQETLESILKMLEASKEIEKYDTECKDCKQDVKKINNIQKQEGNEEDRPEVIESHIGKPYTTFNSEDYEEEGVEYAN